MNRDDIISMAQKAGVTIRCHYDETGATPQETPLVEAAKNPKISLERFAALVAEALIASGELVEAPPQDVEISEPAIPFVPTVRCPVCHTYGHHHSKTCRYQGSGMTHHVRFIARSQP